MSGLTVDRAVVPPAEKVMLMNWLNGGYYTSWYSESKVHASTGPHTDVKVFYNSILEASMKAGNKNHPVGATAVKEQSEGGTHYGWSVSIKLQEESAYGDGWYWFESVDKTDISMVPFEGVGHQLCTGCHVRPGNKDLILSGFPLK